MKSEEKRALAAVGTVVLILSLVYGTIVALVWIHRVYGGWSVATAIFVLGASFGFTTMAYGYDWLKRKPKPQPDPVCPQCKKRSEPYR